MTVSTTARDESGEAELLVANSGPVVPPRQVSELFEPFRRLRNGRAPGREGVGLGLSIVRSVVRAHNGRLLAESREDGGLVIRVRLPAAPRDAAAHDAR